MCLFFVSLHAFGRLYDYLENWDLLRPIFGGKIKEKPPEVLGMDMQNMCAKIHGLSFKKRRATGHVNFCSENMCMLRS